MSRPLALRHGGSSVGADVTFRDGAVALVREGRTVEVAFRREGARIVLAPAASPEAAGEPTTAFVAKDARGLWVAWRGGTWLLVPEGVAGSARGGGDAPDEIRAPMTGRVVTVAATPGARVREGDLLLTIEAMKMEFKLTAPEDGVVGEMACAAGDRVELGQLLVRLDPSPAAGRA